MSFALFNIYRLTLTIIASIYVSVYLFTYTTSHCCSVDECWQRGFVNLSWKVVLTNIKYVCNACIVQFSYCVM